MIDFIAHNLAPIMFVSVMALLLLGYPVAFTLAAGGLAYFVIGVEFSSISPEIRLFWPLLQSHPERIWGVMSNDTLLAVPFFTLMGLILERSGMAEDLLDTIGQLFGRVRGGLAYAVILVGAVLGATTGVVAASVMAMGLISLPIMLRYNYRPSLAAGTIASSGTLAQIIPPSLVLIVMADQVGRSVGDMYAGALYPSLLIVALYALYVFIITLVRPDWAPALPPEARKLGTGVVSLLVMIALAVAIFYGSRHTIFNAISSEEWRIVAALCLSAGLVYVIARINRTMEKGLISRLAEKVIIVLIPPLALIFLVLGTIFLGIATPTEGGAMGAAGAMILAFMRRRLDFKTLKAALLATTELSAFVMMIMIGARVFSLTFYGINGNVWIEDLLTSLPGGEYGFLFVVTVIVFILGCFLDYFEIAFIIVPLLTPVADKLGIDLVWFGIILSINLQTSFLTPPFGFSLFFLRSVAPGVPWKDPVSGRMIQGISTSDIYRGVIPFILIQALMVLIVIAFPQLVMHYKAEHVSDRPASSIELRPPGAAPSGTAPALGLPPMGGLGAPGSAPGQPSKGLPPVGGLPAPSATPASGASKGIPPIGGLGAPPSMPGQAQPAQAPKPSVGGPLSGPPKLTP